MRVGTRKNAVKIRHLDKRFERNALFSGQRAVRRVGQRLHPCPSRVKRPKLGGLLIHAVFGVFVRRKTAVEREPLLQQIVFSCRKALFLFGDRWHVNIRRAGQQPFQLLDLPLLR